MAVTEITAAAEKTIRQRIVGSIFAAQSLFSAATILAFTLSSIIAVDLSGSDSSAGLPNTIGLIARAALAYPFGWLLDRAGRRLGLTIGYLVGVVGVLITALSIIYGSFAGFLISAIFLGGVRASAEQGRYIAAEIYPIGRQASVMGWIVSAGTIGAISGPLLVDPSTKMAEGLGLNPYAGPFLVAAVGLFIAAIVVFTLLRPDPRTLGRKVEQADSASELPISKPVMPTGAPALILGTDPQARSLFQILSKPGALLAMASMTIGQMVMVMLMVITPLHMSYNQHDTQAISLVIMAHTMGMFGLSWLTGRLIERFRRLPMIAAGSLILVLAAVLAPISDGVPILALALFFLGLGWNFAFIAGSSLLSKRLETHERGRVQGAGEIAVSAGAGLGSLGSGIIFAGGGIIAVSATGLGFALALLALVIWVKFIRQSKNDQLSQE